MREIRVKLYKKQGGFNREDIYKEINGRNKFMYMWTGGYGDNKTYEWYYCNNRDFEPDCAISNDIVIKIEEK